MAEKHKIADINEIVFDAINTLGFFFLSLNSRNRRFDDTEDSFISRLLISPDLMLQRIDKHLRNPWSLGRVENGNSVCLSYIYMSKNLKKITVKKFLLYLIPSIPILKFCSPIENTLEKR